MVTILVFLLGVIVILALIAANGYFVAQEFAYMSVDRSRLRALAADGDASAERALRVTGRTSFMLSGAQLGITVTGLLVGYVAEPMVGQSLGVVLDVAGVPPAVSISVGTVLALVVATVVQMIFGELYPKNLAIAKPEPLARRLSRSTLIYLRALGWLITVFDHAANALLRLLRLEPVHDVDSTATAQDLEYIVADSRRSGDLPDELSVLIDRVLDFPGQDVEHAMIPRNRVGTVTADTSIGEVRAAMAVEHTRYPVVADDGEPIGLIELTEVLRHCDDDSATVATVMREPLIVPNMMSLPDVLSRMTEARYQLACVIDEFGSFDGIVTIEDLAEELIGELHDEHDEEIGEVNGTETDGWELDGDVHIDEVSRMIKHPMPEGEYETLAGLLITELGELPDVGRQLDVELPGVGSDLVLPEDVRRVLHVEVLEVARHVPSRVHIRYEEFEVLEDEDADRPSGGDDSVPTEGEQR